MADVATRKILENERMIVWEMTLAPGESAGVHTHHHDYLAYVIEGSTIEALDEDGEHLAQVELESGTSMYLRLEGNELIADLGRFPDTHDARNVGTTVYRELLVEFK